MDFESEGFIVLYFFPTFIQRFQRHLCIQRICLVLTGISFLFQCYVLKPDVSVIFRGYGTTPCIH